MGIEIRPRSRPSHWPRHQALSSDRACPLTTLVSRFEEQVAEQTRLEELRHRVMEQAVEQVIREERQRRLTEAGEKDQGDQS
jgi:hypothetical protein